MQIREDDLSGKKIADFLREHLEDMNEITPPESVHALDLTERTRYKKWRSQINAYRQGSPH